MGRVDSGEGELFELGRCLCDEEDGGRKKKQRERLGEMLIQI